MSLTSFNTLLGRKKQPLDYLEDQSFISGALVGLAVGVVVTLLVAPRSGKELRKKIADTVDDQTKEVHHQWDKTKSQAKETIGDIKANASSVADKAKDKFDSYADEAETKAEKVADKVNSGVDRLESAAKIS
ncbi:YtxH domain-containing protein [Spirosoma pomorum]